MRPDSVLARRRFLARAPQAVRGGMDWAINLWADRPFFQATVPIIFGAIGDSVPAAFIKAT